MDHPSDQWRSYQTLLSGKAWNVNVGDVLALLILEYWRVAPLKSEAQESGVRGSMKRCLKRIRLLGMAMSAFPPLSC